MLLPRRIAHRIRCLMALVSFDSVAEPVLAQMPAAAEIKADAVDGRTKEHCLSDRPSGPPTPTPSPSPFDGPLFERP